MFEVGRDLVITQFEAVVVSGCEQILHAGARREPIPGGSGSAPASHVPVMQYLLATLISHRAVFN